MKKPRLPAIDYIRGVSMLGVVAIHIGALYLANPTPNLGLVALLEIVSRFSVPIFFFISAFGLFYRLDLTEPFAYGKFLRRRFKAILVPYVLWSALYVVHDFFLYGVPIPTVGRAAELLFFGLAKYQLYFLVILAWFYLLMPVWIRVIRVLSPVGLAAVFAVQVGVDYFSSYSVWLYGLTQSLPEGFLRMLLTWRLNYLVLHYVAIFLLGGFLAVRSEEFFTWLAVQKKAVTAGFLLAVTAHVGYFVWLVKARGLSAVGAVNMAHQLSPTGIFYTAAASIFLLMAFQCAGVGILRAPLEILGRESFFVYLFHPLVLAQLERLGLVMTAATALEFFAVTVLVSLVVAVLWRWLRGVPQYLWR